MAAGKPVIANEEIPEHKNVVEQSGGGTLVTYDLRAFADAIIELLNDAERAVEMGKNGQDWTARNRAYQVLAGQVADALRELKIQQR